ncbi:GNAT family N-acetyltransferase [Legionella fairfieldensis]|uniref:GNAT family N-acetyltransferase n=1 Tax=Legionella fairfieldensis TaxID=45064 RepID=UPI0006878EF6|nr:GNAT family protein [Legionella fairfieldensis]
MIYDRNITFRLRLVESYDADFLLALRSDPEIINNLSSFVFLNQTLQKSWIENISSTQDKKYLIFEKNDENQWIQLGLVRIDCIDFVNRSMRVGGDIHQNYRGYGYSKIMYSLIFELGFRVWNLNRLWLFLLSSNSRAFNLYKKLGFQQEGIQRQAIYRNGVYLDHIMMSFLQIDYIKMYCANFKENTHEKHSLV